MIYVGIDNGLTGALCAISDHPGPPLLLSIMPTIGKKKGNEVDADNIWEWLKLAGAPNGCTVILETPGKHSPGVMALCSMWDSYGVIRGILASRKIRHHRIAPQTWQKEMIPGTKKGDTKPAALRIARQIWPHEQWLPSSRHTTPHDGMIDAALIAEYGRRLSL